MKARTSVEILSLIEKKLSDFQEIRHRHRIRLAWPSIRLRGLRQLMLFMGIWFPKVILLLETIRPRIQDELVFLSSWVILTSLVPAKKDQSLLNSPSILDLKKNIIWASPIQRYRQTWIRSSQRQMKCSFQVKESWIIRSRAKKWKDYSLKIRNRSSREEHPMFLTIISIVVNLQHRMIRQQLQYL